MSHFLFKGDTKGGSPFEHLRRSLADKPLLPTLCVECYQVFEIAVGESVEAGHNYTACYCPHTACMAAADLFDIEHHSVIVCGPMDEAMAKALVEERLGIGDSAETKCQ